MSATSVEVGPGSKLAPPMRSSSSCSLTQPRRTTSSERMKADVSGRTAEGRQRRGGDTTSPPRRACPAAQVPGPSGSLVVCRRAHDWPLSSCPPVDARGRQPNGPAGHGREKIGPWLTPARRRRASWPPCSEAVGPAHCLSDPDLKASYELDWTRRFGGPSLVVVRPATPPRSPQVLAACNRFGVAVVPQGGNTGLVGGSVPRQRRGSAQPRPSQQRPQLRR